MKQSYTTKKARLIIHRMIETAIELFSICKRTNEEIERTKTDQQRLRDANVEYEDIIENKREQSNAVWLIILPILAMACDAVITYQAMSVAIEVFGIPSICKILAPLILVGIEIGVSYFQSVEQLEQHEDSWLMRNLQYIVILILIALSILTIMYSISSYSPLVDSIGYILFVIGTVAVQVALLVASVCLHLWLIKNAERIANAIIYLRHSSNYRRVAKQLSSLEHQQRHNNIPAFTKHSQKLIRLITEFNAVYPEQPLDAALLIPQEVLNGMNVAMGRKIFITESERA